MSSLQAEKIDRSSLEVQFNKLTCVYRNETSSIQIIRISKSHQTYLERALPPNEYVQFSAPCDAALEIYEGALFGAVHADTIPCSQIAI